MINRMQTETREAFSPVKVTELSWAELHSVSGGLNPQPLPPRVAFSFLATNAYKISAVWAF